MGITRITRQSGKVTMASLALVSMDTGTSLAWGHAQGQSEGDTYALVGVRQLGNETLETVRTEVTRVHSPSPQTPAGR